MTFAVLAFPGESRPIVRDRHLSTTCDRRGTARVNRDWRPACAASSAPAARNPSVPPTVDIERVCRSSPGLYRGQHGECCGAGVECLQRRRHMPCDFVFTKTSRPQVGRVLCAGESAGQSALQLQSAAWAGDPRDRVRHVFLRASKLLAQVDAGATSTAPWGERRISGMRRNRANRFANLARQCVSRLHALPESSTSPALMLGALSDQARRD